MSELNRAQLQILRREGLFAYAQVLGVTIDEAYKIALNQLDGDPSMSHVHGDVEAEHQEIQEGLKVIAKGQLRNDLNFVGLIVLVVLGLVGIWKTVETTSKFTSKTVPLLLGVEVINEITPNVKPIKQKSGWKITTPKSL